MKNMKTVKYFNMLYFLIFCPDVDVPEPDEKSIITYVSSLYDRFPNVPTLEQSLRENVSIDMILISLEAH